MLHPWWSWGWGWRRFKSNGPDNSSNKNEDYTQRVKDKNYNAQTMENWWEAERARMEQEMERLKKEIEADPYTALFGKRPEPLGRHDWNTSSWLAFCRSFLGLGDSSKGSAKVDGSAASKGAEKSSSDTNINNEVVSKFAKSDEILMQPPTASTTAEPEPSLEYDPISGRMVPKKPSSPEPSSDNTQVERGKSEDVPIKTFKSYRKQFGYKEPENKAEDDAKPQAVTEPMDKGERLAQDHNMPSAEKDAEKSKKDVFYMNAPSTDSMPSTPPSSSQANSVSEQTNYQIFSGQPDNTKAVSHAEPIPGRPSDTSGDGSSESSHQSSQQKSCSGALSYLDTPKVRETAEQGGSDFLTGNKTPGQSASADVLQRKDYAFQEDKTDDVDLLRASDICASFSSRKTKQDLEAEKQKSRQALEADFDSYQDPGSEIRVRDIRSCTWKDEISPMRMVHADGSSDIVAGSRKDQQILEESATEAVTSQPESQTQTTGSKLVATQPETRPDQITAQAQQEATASPDAKTPESKEQNVTDDKLVREIQKIYEDSYGEITPEHRQGRPKGESASLESCQAQQAPQTVAPSSITEDLSPPSGKLPDMKIVTLGWSAEGDSSKSGISQESQLDALLKDVKQFSEQRNSIMKALEETIDRINAPRSERSSTQPPADKRPPVTTTASKPARYRILAYDSSTLRVTSAETTSSVCSAEAPLPPAEVLSRLNNPAKFLPYFAGMQADGYEIVSGGGDILVFKKVREAAPRARTAEPVANANNNVSATSSSTGTQLPKEAAQVDEELIDQMVEKDKTQFRQATSTEPASDTGALPKEESFIRKTSRRVLLTGVATAATCYAIGVVVEYFRTGGEDGRGPEGFTEFEAERRRMR